MEVILYIVFINIILILLYGILFIYMYVLCFGIVIKMVFKVYCRLNMKRCCIYMCFKFVLIFLIFRNNERKDVMFFLIKMTREGNFNFWDEYFKIIFFVLLEIFGDINVRK